MIGGVDDADITHQPNGKTGRQSGRQDIDERVAEKNCTDHLLGRAEQSINGGGADVAFLFERVHARARGGRERGLGAVEEGGQGNQHRRSRLG